MKFEDEIDLADVKTKILYNAVLVFRQYGFKSVTMDDIARRSGISKKTLYQYFDNKNTIVAEAMAWYKKGIRCDCDHLMETASNALEAFVKIKAKFDLLYKEMNPIAFHELQRFYPEGYQQFKTSLEEDVAAIKLNLQQGINEELYRAELNTEVLARFHMETVMMIMTPNVLTADNLNMQVVSREILEHYIYGIITPKGEKLYKKYKEKYLTN